MRRLLPLWLVLASIPAVMFLLPDGFFASSDGMIHLYRLFELDRSLHADILYPRWFPLSGYGYGLPVLNYYPPLSYYLAELFHLAGAGYIAALKWLIASGFVVAAFSMFLFARDRLGPGAAFVAGVSYAYLPYLLSDAYVRGNLPEFLAMCLLPLALWAFQRVFAAGENHYVIIAAVSYAAIILTHHLTAMLFTALLLAYGGFLFARHRVRRCMLAFVAALLLALALSAFYWLPALAELNLVYVGPASVARFIVSRLADPVDFFAPSLAYAYLPQSEALTHSAGFPQTMLALLAGIVAVGVAFRRGRTGANLHLTSYVLLFSLIVALAISMMLTFSAPLWYAIPPLRFLQFPWRFQVLAGVGIAFLLGVWTKWILDRLIFKMSWLAYLTFAVVLIALGIANLSVRVIALNDASLDLRRSGDADYVVAQMGWSWTREFVPATVQEFEAIYAPAAKPDLPRPDPTRASPSIQIQNAGWLSRALRVTTQEPFELSLHAFYFPGWQAYVDGAPARTYPRGSLGLASVGVPSGVHSVLFRFEETPLRSAANVLSLIAFAAVLVWPFVAHRRLAMALTAAVVVILALFAWHTRADARAQPPIPLNAGLDQQVILLGYSSEREADAMYVTLYWLASNEMDEDYASYVHLIDATGAVVSQHDGPTGQGLTPTTRWLPGEIIGDPHALALKAIAPGEYGLAAGMYLPLENGYKSLGDEIELGPVTIRP